MSVHIILASFLLIIGFACVTMGLYFIQRARERNDDSEWKYEVEDLE